MDRNIVIKIADKLTKYKDLQIELTKTYDLKKVEIIPVIIGTLGTVTTGLEEYVQTISKDANTDIMIKSALLGTAYIIRIFHVSIPAAK